MNMKTYLPTTLLIFFLLLVDKPVSPSLINSWKPLIELGKDGLKEMRGIAIETGLKNLMAQYQNNPPQQQSPNTQPHLIEGLSSVKSYLYNYGYLLSQSYPPSFTDTLDDGTKQAIMNYQSAFNLNITGFPDKATIEKMLQLRCGVPDMNLRYTLDHTNRVVSWPKGKNWSPNPSSLTYGFNSSISNASADAFRGLFNDWSNATGVNLTEVHFDHAQIKVTFYDYFISDYSSRMEIAGSTIIQRVPQSSGNYNYGYNYNVAGIIILENRQKWDLPRGLNSVNVVMHQIGHILGLEHSLDQESIMHPSFVNPQQQTKQLSYSDKQQISRLSSGGGSLISDKYQPVCGGSGSRWGLLVATLSIGFSCMALYY